MAADYSAYDDVLTLLEGYGPELKNGLTSHVPMVGEALVALGRGDDARRWVSKHRNDVLPRPPRVADIDEARWREALGDDARFEDWSVLFSAQIAHNSWRDVLNVWAQRLSPGYPASATHGVIRTGHAVRALRHGVDERRLRELADGLALWASSYAALPDEPFAGSARPVAEALLAVPKVPLAQRSPPGAITRALAGLSRMPGYASVRGQADPSGPLQKIALDLARLFAPVLVEHATTGLGAIVFTHSVTGVVAVMHMLPVLDAEVGRTLLSYAWQTGAALYAVYASDEPVVPHCQPLSPDVLVERAVAHGDDHVIKLTEACVWLYRLRPDEVFLIAPQVAMLRLEAL